VLHSTLIVGTQLAQLKNIPERKGVQKMYIFKVANLSKKLFIVTFLFLILAPALSAISEETQWVAFDANAAQAKPTIKVLQSNAERTILRIDIPGMEVSKRTDAGKIWHRLKIPKYGITTVAGKPELPFIGTLVGIPWDKGVKLTIRRTAQPVKLNGYTVYPYQEHSHEQDAVFQLDEELYAKKAFYPGKLAKVSNPGILRDYRVVHLAVYPIQYNPATSQLKVYKHITIQLDYSQEPMTLELEKAKNRQHVIWPGLDDMYRRVIVNYDSLSPCQMSARSTDFAYYIITTDELRPAIMDLVNYYMPEYHMLMTIYSGTPTPNQIRNRIRLNYIRYNLKHVLLVGDHEQIPAYNTSTTSEKSGDHQYATLDGWGDYYRDVMIGRISGDTPGQVTTQVNKILTYLESPPLDSWPSRHLLIASDQEPEYKECKENIRNQWWPPPTSFWRLYRDGSGDGPATQANINDRISNYHYGTVNFRGHGTETSYILVHGYPCCYIDSDVKKLSNGNYTPLVFCIACLTGQFFYPYGECLMEDFVRHSDANGGSGAVGALGATIPTSRPDNNTFDNDLYCWVIRENEDIGSCVFYAMAYTQSVHGANSDVTTYHWFGDPAMKIWKDTPMPAASKLAMSKAKPASTMLMQNFPDPFNPDTWIPYTLSKDTAVTVKIYNVPGQIVRTLNLGQQQAGEYTTREKAVYWNGKNDSGEQLASGVYFYTIKAGDYMATRKMFLLK